MTGATMTGTPSGSPGAYRALFGSLKEDLPGASLPWLRALRETAIEHFDASGPPTPKVEAWKYTNLRPLQKIAFAAVTRLAETPGPDLIPSLLPEGTPRHRLVFVNGRLRPELSLVSELPDGVRLESFASGVEALEDSQSLLGSSSAFEAQPMLALNTAFMDDGFVLHLASGVTLEDPIEVVFIGGLADQPIAYHPRCLIVLEEGSRASLIEHHVGLGGETYFVNSATNLRLGAGAELRHLKLQDEAGDAFHLATLDASLARDASYANFCFALGARLSRNEITLRLEGSGAHCRLDGAYLMRGQQHCDNTTVIEHRAPQTTCRELFKGVLDDSARAVFQGRILVQRGAQQSDGHQLSKALLLSNRAEIDAKPELEIYADDVKCAHGATAGELDHEALFYLRSRGVPEARARSLLIEAFLTEALDEIASEDLRQALRTRIGAWLPTSETINKETGA